MNAITFTVIPLITSQLQALKGGTSSGNTTGYSDGFMDGEAVGYDE